MRGHSRKYPFAADATNAKLEIDNGRSEANPPNNKFKKPHDATSKLPVYSSQVGITSRLCF